MHEEYKDVNLVVDLVIEKKTTDAIIICKFSQPLCL